MAAGIPVVGSDAGGLPEVVRHAECGYLLPVGDVEGLAERCCEILRDKERRREMGEAGSAPRPVPLRRGTSGRRVRGAIREFDVASAL